MAVRLIAKQASEVLVITEHTVVVLLVVVVVAVVVVVVVVVAVVVDGRSRSRNRGSTSSSCSGWNSGASAAVNPRTPRGVHIITSCYAFHLKLAASEAFAMISPAPRIPEEIKKSSTSRAGYWGQPDAEFNWCEPEPLQ